jgi:hypothetical protein
MPVSGGLIARLKEDKGAVAAHASSVLGRQLRKSPKNLIDGNPNTYFQSALDDQNPSFTIQFTTVKVKVSAYTIRGWGVMSPRSWVIEGGDEVATGDWVRIDEQRNCELLAPDQNKENRAVKFCVSPIDRYFQFIRLRQTGVNHGGTNFLVVSQFEIFGVTANVSD